MWTSEGGTRLEILKKLAKEFEAENPNVTVKWTVRDFGTYPAQIKLALSSEDGPDVAIGNLGWSLDGPLIKAGLFRPLDDYAKAYGWDTRYPEVGLRQLKFSEDGTEYGEGPIWGTPYASDVIGWFYNKDLLADLDMEVPTTLDELEDVLAASKAAGQQPIVFGNKDAWPAWHLLYNLVDQYAPIDDVSGIVYGDEGATYETDEIKEATAKMVEWKEAGYIRDDVNAIAQADASAGFLKGNGLFFPAGSWEAAAMPDNIGFFLTPPIEEGETPRATGSFGYAWHIASNSDNVQAGAAFIDFTTNEDAAREFFAAGDIAPLPVEDPELKEGELYSDIFDAWTHRPRQRHPAALPGVRDADVGRGQLPGAAADPRRPAVDRRRARRDRGQPPEVPDGERELTVADATMTEAGPRTSPPGTATRAARRRRPGAVGGVAT